MLPAKATHITAKIKRMHPSVEFFPPFVFLPPAFSTILGEDSSREELENTPSGERVEVHRLWLVWVPRTGS